MKVTLAGLFTLLSLGVQAEVQPASVAVDYNHFGFDCWLRRASTWPGRTFS
jgi:hypothetical protein